MELNEFLEKFLPEYEDEKRFAEIRIRRLCCGISRADLKDMVCKYLSETYFPKALQNFSDKLCEKQIKNCHKVLKREGTLSAIHCDEVIMLMESEHPKIKEL